MTNFIKKFMVVFILAISMTFITGCSTKVVPPGTIVIVLKANGESKIYTEGSYLAWGRDRVYYVDTKLKSFTEKLKVLCVDNINMDVDVKWVGSFAVDKNKINIIKKSVPAVKSESKDISGYKLSLDKFYRTAMKDIIRANAREVVSEYNTDNIRDNRVEIQKKIRSKVITRFKELNFPINTIDVMVSNLDYPKEITAQRKAIKNAQLEDQKQAALAKAAIAQAKREAAIAREQGKAKIELAKADAMANKIRAESLTPEIIAVKQWDTLKEIAGKEGEMMIVPYSALSESFNSSMIGKRVQIK